MSIDSRTIESEKLLDNLRRRSYILHIRSLSYINMHPTNQPTPAELEILDILWEKKKATVREVFTEIIRRRPAKYTTVLKLLQIMQSKGLVVRDEKDRAHIYRARPSKKDTQKKLVGTLVEKVFRGSALSLVQHVLETKPATNEELAAIRKMIDDAEARGERK